MAVTFKGSTVRVRRQCMAGHDVRILQRLIGDIVEIHVEGARAFAGTITSIDEPSGFLQLDQLCGRPAIIRLDTIVAVEQHRADEVWALVPEEGAA